MTPCIANIFRSPHLEKRLSAGPELDRVTENPTAATEENRVSLADKSSRISSSSLRKDRSRRLEKLGHFVFHLLFFFFVNQLLLFPKVDAEKARRAISVENCERKKALFSPFLFFLYYIHFNYSHLYSWELEPKSVELRGLLHIAALLELCLKLTSTSGTSNKIILLQILFFSSSLILLNIHIKLPC